MLLFAKAFKAVNIANYEGNIEDSCVFIDISDVFGTYFLIFDLISFIKKSFHGRLLHQSSIWLNSPDCFSYKQTGFVIRSTFDCNFTTL